MTKRCRTALLLIGLAGCSGSNEGLPIAFTYSGYDGVGMWIPVSGFPEPRMKYLLYRPSDRRVNSTSTPYFRVPPTGRPLSIHPEGLYWNGTAVPLDRNRVFVVTRDLQIAPVPLSDQDLAALETRSVHSPEFYKGEVWKQRILPAVKKAAGD